MTDPTRRPLGGTALYNPHLLSKEELVSLFVVRRSLLDRLLQAIAGSSPGQAPQHDLLVGQRGMGKTMFLRRLRFAVEDDPELSRHWLPLTFPEEQYNVARLSDFWLNCVDALSDVLESGEGQEAAQILDAEAEVLRDLAEGERAQASLALLVRGATDAGRRLVLLVDNVDLVFERIKAQGWALREVLSQESTLLLIGASSELIEATYKYDQPFYDFFQVHELAGLTEEETRQLLAHYAEVWETPAVTRVLEEEPGRIATLHALSGGNPRTVALLHTVLAQGLDGDIRRDLESLLDHCTPLYKARLEALAPQAQQVLHALAVHWYPAAAGELAEGLQLDVNAVSSQLNRLVRQGIVEKVPYDPATKTGFQIAERFFNIWYLMRVTRRARRKLLWLVKLLPVIYTPDQLRHHARQHLGRAAHLPPEELLPFAEFSLALADSVADSSAEPTLEETLEIASLHCVIRAPELEPRLRELFDLEGADARLKSRAEHHQRLQQVEQRVSAVQTRPDWSPTSFWAKLGGAPLALEAKERIADRLPRLDAGELVSLEAALDQLMEDFEAAYSSKRTVRGFTEALRKGLMMSIDDVEGARVLEETTATPGLAAVAVTERLRREKEARPLLLRELQSHLEHVASPSVRIIWALHALDTGLPREEVLSVLSELSSKDDRRAEESLPSMDWEWMHRFLSKALAHRSATAWVNLGRMLHQQRGHQIHQQHSYQREAEIALRQALSIKPESHQSWFTLGNVLAEQIGRAGDAEAAYREAIALFPPWIYPWYNLGCLLAAQEGRMEEAEAAFREALERQPGFSQAWHNLGLLLSKDPTRTEAAEDALRKAIQSAPWDSPYPSTMALAWLLYQRGKRLDQAAAMAREAAALEPESPWPWRILSLVLLREGPWEEAQKAARRFLMSLPPEREEETWQRTLELFQQAVVAGRAREAGDLLDELELADRWRPLREALEVVARENRTYLRRLAPEVRVATEEILRVLTASGED